MALSLPRGKRLAVSLTTDFDAHSVWMGTFGSTSQSMLSRGEFGAAVGAPRLLKAFEDYDIRTTWFIPTHTMSTFRPAVDEVLERGHEVAAHGVYHEHIPKLDEAEQRRLLELQLSQHEAQLGTPPRGYRSPAFDVTDVTLDLLVEYGFDWDSSLMGRDVEPYRPRMVTTVDREAGNAFGTEIDILEFPVSWFLDDFPDLEWLPGSPQMQSSETVLRRWIDTFDFAYERCPGGVLTWTLHPQTVGRPHNLLMLERFLDHVASHDGIWFPTVSELYDCWTEPS